MVNGKREGTKFTIPADATGFYMSLRIQGTAVVDETIEFHILDYMDNETLQELVLSGNPSISIAKHPVNIIKTSQADADYLIRASYDNDTDVVYSIGIPSTVYNHVISFTDIRLIPAQTDVENTKTAYTSASVYKKAGDEIPAMSINGNFVGSNHGNPNYTQVDCVHSLDETYIGTVWTDPDNYEYTLVNVLSASLVFGTLDENDQLVKRSPASLTYEEITITPTATRSYQLRRSAINKKYTIVNDSGSDASLGGGGNNIIVTEDYDINDQSAGLVYLQQNVGNNTNDSYFDDGQSTLLAHITNTFIFNRNGSITVYGSLIAKKSFVDDRIFGCMSLNFSVGNIGSDNLYVPNSSNCKTIKSYVGNADDFTVGKDDSEIMHHRYYQLSDNHHAHFLHILNMGCYNNAERKTISRPAYNSSSANKFYCNITGSKNMNAGDVLSWGYGRGPFKYSSDQTVLCWFDYNNGYILSMDWHNDYSGLVELPYYMAGKSIEILEKSDSVTVTDSIITNVGVQVSCNDYGYVVMYLH